MRDIFNMKEIIFEVREDEVDGGFVAVALGHAIATQGDSLEELREMVRDAVHCHFGDEVPDRTPKIIRLYFVRDEAMAV
jgi:predicted RNase H-like HicB family nuclease